MFMVQFNGLCSSPCHGSFTVRAGSSFESVGYLQMPHEYYSLSANSLPYACPC